MPVVTVPVRPRGDPIATTGCPTTSEELSPSVDGVSPEAPCSRITAMS